MSFEREIVVEDDSSLQGCDRMKQVKVEFLERLEWMRSAWNAVEEYQ